MESVSKIIQKYLICLWSGRRRESAGWLGRAESREKDNLKAMCIVEYLVIPFCGLKTLRG